MELQGTPNKKYSSKILLFGEYSVLDGSAALVTPFPSYFGSWSRVVNTDSSLEKFLLSLNTIDTNLTADAELIKSDIEEGICFDSNIKMGYGMGSSGALTAAAFDRYFELPEDTDHLQLKSVLATIENYFHGRSSGIDALAIYLNQSLVITDKQLIEPCQLNWEFIKAHFFLVDTQMDRKAQDLIKIYKSEISQSIDLSTLKAQVSNAIEGTLAKQVSQINTAIQNISTIQWNAFKPMIPSSIHALWSEGLSTGKFSIKLLGAGGGGYALGFSTDLRSLDDHDQIIRF